MGIALNLAIVMRDWFQRHGVAGPAVTLGVQDLDFTEQTFATAIGRFDAAPATPYEPEPMTAKALFREFGLGTVRALDVSDFEGAEIIFDLNARALPRSLTRAFRLVVNGGTLEHVVHVPNAMRNIDRMVRPGGHVLHAMPCHNWVNHGFYQFSPTFVFDYCSAAGHEVLEAALISFDSATPQHWRVEPVGEDLAALTGANSLDARTRLLCALVKTGEQRRDIESAPPTQRYYAAHPPTRQPTRWFPLFDLHHGSRVEYPCRAIVPLRGAIHRDGHAWVVEIPELAMLADTVERPYASPVMILEDTSALGPAHSSHELIARVGGGAFSHWGSSLIFSTSDGSDPASNGRDYLAVVPHPGQAV